MVKKIAVIASLAVLLLLPVGCQSAGVDEALQEESVKIRIGTLPTEDALALFVAEERGLFDDDSGLDVEIITFSSAHERDAALQAGEIDGFMGDMIATAMLRNGGVPVSIVSIMLGSEPDQGRFAILVPPDSDVTSVEDLRGKSVAISSDTIIDFVGDMLLKQHGIDKDEVEKVEVKKIPVRFEMLMSSQVDAAILPDPLVALAESNGATIIADDTTGENLSQTILLFHDDFLEDNSRAVTELLRIQNIASELINANPDQFKDLLVEKARLPEAIADAYVVSEYPVAQVPRKEEVDRVLGWLIDKELISPEIDYDSIVNSEVLPE